jgi:hypothetical protein
MTINIIAGIRFMIAVYKLRLAVSEYNYELIILIYSILHIVNY